MFVRRLIAALMAAAIAVAADRHDRVRRARVDVHRRRRRHHRTAPTIHAEGVNTDGDLVPIIADARLDETRAQGAVTRSERSPPAGPKSRGAWDRDVLDTYVAARSPLSPAPLDRITRVH